MHYINFFHEHKYQTNVTFIQNTETYNCSDTYPSQDNTHCGLVGYDMSNGQHKVVTIVTEELASSIFMTD
jgi:uncharacterized membrane protein